MIEGIYPPGISGSSMVDITFFLNFVRIRPFGRIPAAHFSAMFSVIQREGDLKIRKFRQEISLFTEMFPKLLSDGKRKGP
jgi:hypothetical protein